MPRLKYLQSPAEKRQNEIAEDNKRLRAEIKRICGNYDITNGEFAKETGISESTFSRKMRNPAKFTLGDIMQMKRRFREFNLGI